LGSKIDSKLKITHEKNDMMTSNRKKYYNLYQEEEKKVL